MKKQALGVFVVGLMLLMAGCGQQKNVANPVDTEAIQKEPVEKTVQTFGIVNTKKVKGIMLDLPANIEKIHVQKGDRVKKGDILITLNLKEIEGQIEEKEDALKISKFELQKMIAQGNNNTEIEQAENNLQVAKSQYDELKKDLNKQEILLKEEAISQNKYDEFKKTVEQKEKEVKNCKLSLDNLKQNLQVKEKIEILDTEIKKQNVVAQERALAILNEKIKESGIEGNKIICDVENGVVDNIYNAAGDRLNPEKQIMSILDIDTLIVEANVVEDFIKDVSLNCKAVIVPLADSSKQYEGRITRIANMAVQQNGETVIPVEIEVENADEFLLPNFNVNIKIIVDEKDDSLASEK